MNYTTAMNYGTRSVGLDFLDPYIGDIGNEAVHDAVGSMLDSAADGFFRDPSSSSGRHHPDYDQIVGDTDCPGGIVVHTAQVCRFAIEGFARYPAFGPIDDAEDIILAACLLHDVRKNGHPWGDATDYEHGQLAALEWLASVHTVSSDPIAWAVAACLEYHMGRWSQPCPFESHTPEALRVASQDLGIRQGAIVDAIGALIAVVQEADYYASRSFVGLPPGELGLPSDWRDRVHREEN